MRSANRGLPHRGEDGSPFLVAAVLHKGADALGERMPSKRGCPPREEGPQTKVGFTDSAGWTAGTPTPYRRAAVPFRKDDFCIQVQKHREPAAQVRLRAGRVLHFRARPLAKSARRAREDKRWRKKGWGEENPTQQNKHACVHGSHGSPRAAHLRGAGARPCGEAAPPGKGCPPPGGTRVPPNGN